MDAEQQQHLQELRGVYQKRLRVLELQAANKGQDTPPHIQLEIKDLKRLIADLDEELTGKTRSTTYKSVTSQSHLKPWHFTLLLIGLLASLSVNGLLLTRKQEGANPIGTQVHPAAPPTTTPTSTSDSSNTTPIVSPISIGSSNLIRNGDFENGSGGWEGNLNILPGPNGQSGCSVQDKSADVAREPAKLNQTVPVIPKGIYKLSGEIKLKDAAKFQIKIQWSDSSNAPIGSAPVIALPIDETRDWHPISYPAISAPEGAAHATIIFSHGESLDGAGNNVKGSTVCLDNLTFTRVK